MSRKAPPPRRSRLFTFPSGPLLLDEPPHSPDNKLPMYHGPLVPVSEPPRP